VSLKGDLRVKSFDEYKSFESSGRSLLGVIQAFGQFKGLASQLLLEEGIGRKGPDGLIVLDPEGWYPMSPYLRALAKANEQMGDSVLHQIGVSVAKAVWMPSITSVRLLAESLDVGYHMHHRKHGQPMWDPVTKHMREGIGHYRYREHNAHEVEIESEIPYPCAFDRGLLFGALRMLNTAGAILHDESQPCRKRGNASCVYIVKG
jgi:hypothetical protein